MSKEKAKNEELAQKLVDLLKTQTTQCETADVLKGLKMLNTSGDRNLLRRVARETEGVVIETVNERLRFSFGKKPAPPAKTNAEPKKKTEKPTEPAKTEETKTETAQKPALKPKKEPKPLKPGDQAPSNP